MKLTIYLRLSEDGRFLFSNTTSFETNKSSGTFQAAEGGWLMVYDSVNGEEKSISDGLTSSFVILEDGSLDFTGCERIYYGSAGATTTSEEHPDAKLTAHVIPADYEMPSTESAFTEGCYISEDGLLDITFFEDGSYMLRRDITGDAADPALRISDGWLMEGGYYSVSTTQLAMEPGQTGRYSGEVVSDEELVISAPGAADGERENITVRKAEESAVRAYGFSGEGTVTGTNEAFSAELSIRDDGTFTVTADGFTEEGIILLNPAEGWFQIYPDNPTDGVRGLKQVPSVPTGTLSRTEDGKLVLSDFRARTGESLARDKCSFTETD